MARRLHLVLACLALSCVERNPVRAPPDHAELAGGGVWVAHNLGCEVGCDQIRRGDRILVVDGRAVATGVEVDALDLARGEPVQLRVARHGTGDEVDVTIVAWPNDSLPPIAALPPLMTVGTAALDRAPVWARGPMFGHAIPPIFVGEANGRQLYGRAALIFDWKMPRVIEARQDLQRELPGLYAHVQSFADRLRAAGVYTCFGDPLHASRTPDEDLRRRALPGTTGYLPRCAVVTATDPVHGIEDTPIHLTADHILEIVILDRRGIVRFHSQGYPAGPRGTIDAALEFALRALDDGAAEPGAVCDSCVESGAPAIY